MCRVATTCYIDRCIWSTNEASPNAEQIRDFIQFADSEEGRDVIRKNGTVPYLEGLNLMKHKRGESRQARQESGLR